jgi:hypothetical protein
MLTCLQPEDDRHTRSAVYLRLIGTTGENTTYSQHNCEMYPRILRLGPCNASHAAYLVPFTPYLGLLNPPRAPVRLHLQGLRFLCPLRTSSGIPC